MDVIYVTLNKKEFEKEKDYKYVFSVNSDNTTLKLHDKGFITDIEVGDKEEEKYRGILRKTLHLVNRYSKERKNLSFKDKFERSMPELNRHDTTVESQYETDNDNDTFTFTVEDQKGIVSIYLKGIPVALDTYLSDLTRNTFHLVDYK